MSLILPEKLQSEGFSASLKNKIIVPLAVTKAGSNCSKLAVKSLGGKEEEKEEQEATEKPRD